MTAALSLSRAVGRPLQTRGIIEGFAGGVAPCQYKDKWPRDIAPQRGGSAPAGHRHVDTRAERRKQYAHSVIPKHVQHCHHNGSTDWWIYTWSPGAPDLVTRVPYSCNSWRCKWCRRHEASVAFARIKEGFETIEGYDSERVGFFVLTIDRNGYYSGEPWKNAREAYAAISRNARRFLKRLNRLAERQGVEPVGSRWVGTVEAHKSGWPHYQLMLYLPKEWAKQLPQGRKDGRNSGALCSEIRRLAEATGWGRRSTFEASRGADAAMGYLIKTAGGHDKSVGEVSKLTQLPLNAPERFRRIRSGKTFLPPRRKSGKTGTLIRRQWCQDGTPQAMTLHEIKDPEAREASARCCYHEEKVWEWESSGMVRAARKVWPQLARELVPNVMQIKIGAPRGPPTVGAGKCI